MALVAFCLVSAMPAPAQDDMPSADLLRALVPQLGRKLPATTVTFAPATNRTDDRCGMQPSNLTVARGSASRTFQLLVDASADSPVVPKQFLARIARMTVDADGSERAYHPDDPYGEGVCHKVRGRGGEVVLDGICALDAFASGGVRIFRGTQRLSRANAKSGGADLADEWKALWPLIRDRKVRGHDLRALAGPEAPDGLYLFHSRERNLTAVFARAIIPSTKTNYPCVRGDESRYPGYFVAATTLNRHATPREDGCTPAGFVDSEDVPFFVLPASQIGQAGIGDIVVGYLKVGGHERIAFGIVADTGPFDQIGEGSIAFNRDLLGTDDVVMNVKGVYGIDISLAALERRHGAKGVLGVLVLGGTRPMLGGDYSRANIEKIGRREFANWSRGDSLGRLNACLAQAPVNSHPAGR